MSALNYVTFKLTRDLSLVQTRSLLPYFPVLGNVLKKVRLNQQLPPEVFLIILTRKIQ